MIHNLGPEAYHALQRALGGAYTLPVCDGRVRVIGSGLPGHAICAAAIVAGVLWIVLDFDKPSAHRHARVMLAEWRERYGPAAEAGASSPPASSPPAAGPPTMPMRLPLRVAV